MASILDLKKEVDSKTEKSLRITFVRATEAHLLAKEMYVDETYAYFPHTFQQCRGKCWCYSDRPSSFPDVLG